MKSGEQQRAVYVAIDPDPENGPPLIAVAADNAQQAEKFIRYIIGNRASKGTGSPYVGTLTFRRLHGAMYYAKAVPIELDVNT